MRERRYNFRCPWRWPASATSGWLCPILSSHSPNWCRPAWNPNLLSSNCDTLDGEAFFHVYHRTGNEKSASEEEKQRDTLEWLRQFVLTLFMASPQYQRCLKIHHASERNCAAFKYLELWRANDFCSRHCLWGRRRGKTRKAKQAMFFKVSKKVSTTLFMILLNPVGKFISSLKILRQTLPRRLKGFFIADKLSSTSHEAIQTYEELSAFLLPTWAGIFFFHRKVIKKVFFIKHLCSSCGALFKYLFHQIC